MKYGQMIITTGSFQYIEKENNYMITFIKMKYKEWKLKLAFYSMIETVIKEQDDIISTIASIYESLKGTTGQELQDKLITAIAELAHDQAVKEREVEKNRTE